MGTRGKNSAAWRSFEVDAEEPGVPEKAFSLDLPSCRRPVCFAQFLGLNLVDGHDSASVCVFKSVGRPKSAG
ncbi:hypothetical protein TorRG33x02_178820 [Trema orientale]|uniref:Uncharacterized protein n=1 Tax=Trema orientale TaxID=63057 RepID=A0A2P5EL81_TREOI|nr:hypothetical protein TorRG33x02_178820 [Trema orientale]